MKVIPIKYKDIVVALLIICASLMTMYTSATFFFRWPVDSVGFVWGIMIFHYEGRIKAILLKYQIRVNVILGTLSIVFGILYLRFKLITFFGEYILKLILGVVILGFILSLCYKFSFKGKWITWMGHISYEVYLFHLVVINNLKQVLTECNGGVFILMVVILSLLGATMVHSMTKRINQMLSRKKMAKK